MNIGKNSEGWIDLKAEFYFGLSKIESKGTFSGSQTDQLLSKWENMTEKWVLVDLSEHGPREGSLLRSAMFSGPTYEMIISALFYF